MRERKSDSNSQGTCNRVTSGIVCLFKSESNEEAWIKINKELREHLESIYQKISECTANSDIHNKLYAAYFKNAGDDTLGILRNEISQLNNQHRATIGICERISEKALYYSIALINCAIMWKRNNFHLYLGNLPDFDNPLSEKSPFSPLSHAIDAYRNWYKQIPKQFIDGSLESISFQKTCENIKKELHPSEEKKYTLSSRA